MPFTHGGYLVFLATSLLGLAIIDYRWKLAVAHNWKRGLSTVATGVVFFLAWDCLGVWRGIFFEGHNPWLIGLNVAPNVPVEELFFLTLMCYQALILYRAFQRSVRG